MDEHGFTSDKATPPLWSINPSLHSRHPHTPKYGCTDTTFDTTADTDSDYQSDPIVLLNCIDLVCIYLTV